MPDAWIVMRCSRVPVYDDENLVEAAVPVLVCYDEMLAQAFVIQAIDEVERMRGDLTIAYQQKIAARFARKLKRPNALSQTEGAQARRNVRPSCVDGLSAEMWDWDDTTYRVVGPVPIRGPS